MKRFIVTFVAVWAAIGLLSAQSSNTCISVTRAYMGKIQNGTPSELEVTFDLHKAKVVTMGNYILEVSLWREKDSSHPVCIDGVVKDWSGMERMSFAVAPRKSTLITNAIYSPKATGTDLRVVDKVKYKGSWPSYDKWDVYHQFFIQKDFMTYCASQRINNVYVRYDLEYDAKEFKMGVEHVLKEEITNGTGKLTIIPIKATAPTTKYGPLQVKAQLTKAEGTESMGNGETENGYNLNFEFPSHPKDCPFEVTLSFWREKDPLNPLYQDGKIEDFKMMDMMQFTQSTKDPSNIGAMWANEEDYTMESEYIVEKNKWEPFSIYLPEALFQNFVPPYVSDDVDKMTVRYYIMYQLSSNADFVSNESHELPWVEMTYTRQHETPELPELPEPGDDCLHLFSIKNNPSMYFKEIPQPGGSHNLPTNHVHYYYLEYFPSCTILPITTYVANKELPDEFTFTAGQHKSLFVRNIEDRHISQTAATEGLWVAMFPDKEVSRGHSADDTTPLRNMCLEQADALMDRMNEYAKAHNIPWMFTVATCEEAKRAEYEYVEKDEEDDEAFTTDGRFYITAQSTLPATVTAKTTYQIVSKYTAVCRYPECDLKDEGTIHRTRRKTAERADKYCENYSHWYELKNKQNKENLERLLKGLSEGKKQGKVGEQPKYIWYVENHPVKECTKCGKRLQMDSTIEEFLTQDKAEKYYKKLKQ